MATLKLKSRAGVKDGIRWGYALGWYGEFGVTDDNDTMAKLKFLTKYNFKNTHIFIDQLDKKEDAEKDAIFAHLAEHDMDLMPIVGFNYMDVSEDEAKKETDRQVKLLDKYAPLLRNRICHTGLSASDRFRNQKPLAEILDTLSDRIGPLAEGCAQVGTPLCTENHGDYYVSDIVKLCQLTPHLYIFLDTGNTYLLGEKPIPAYYEAAPYTIGGHFKDQRVQPQPQAYPLNFEVGNSDIGGGNAHLRECWDILRKHAPVPENLTMMFEMFPPPGMDPITCLENSIAFVKSLEGSTL